MSGAKAELHVLCDSSPFQCENCPYLRPADPLLWESLSPEHWRRSELHALSCPLLTDGREPKLSICCSVLWEGTGMQADLARAAVTVGVSEAASVTALRLVGTHHTGLQQSEHILRWPT